MGSVGCCAEGAAMIARALARLFALVWRRRLDGRRVVRATGWRSAIVDSWCRERVAFQRRGET